jgi:hypothetical protein
MVGDRETVIFPWLMHPYYPQVRFLRMPGEPIKKQIKEVQAEVGELVKRALVQAGDLRDVEEKLKALAEKASKATPLPEAPSGEDSVAAP